MSTIDTAPEFASEQRRLLEICCDHRENDNVPIAVDENLCGAPVRYVCVCRRCNSEPTDAEKFWSCADHRAEVGRRHLRMRGREASWMRAAPRLREDRVPLAPPHRAETTPDKPAIDALGELAVSLLGYLRPEVRWFAMQMERKLRDNDHKGGWVRTPTGELLERLGEETRELEDELKVVAPTARPSPVRIVDESADVANYAMMIASNHHVGPRGPVDDFERLSTEARLDLEALIADRLEAYRSRLTQRETIFRDIERLTKELENRRADLESVERSRAEVDEVIKRCESDIVTDRKRLAELSGPKS